MAQKCGWNADSARTGHGGTRAQRAPPEGLEVGDFALFFYGAFPGNMLAPKAHARGAFAEKPAQESKGGRLKRT
jgi:hypothetical protein